MASSNIKIHQTILLLCSLFNLVKSDSRQSYSNRLLSRSFGCLSTANASIPFQNNVNLLLSDFNQQSSITGFYNTSIGDSPNWVFGYFMCRADINHQLCNSCMVNGTQLAIDADCKHVDGIYFSEMCIFGYSNHNMYGLFETNTTGAFDFFQVNVSNPQQFNRTLSSTLESVIEKAAFGRGNNGSQLGFATMEAKVSGNDEIIYTLAQCTPDIVGANCSRCLRSALWKSENVVPAGTFTRPKCHLRYDNISFYDLGGPNVSNAEQFRLPDLLAFYSVLFLFLYFNFL